VISQLQQGGSPLSVRQLCALLEVNRAWYYQAQRQATQPDPEIALRDAIEQVVLEFAGYGYRRVTKALQRAGWQVNHKRVLRIMQQESLLCHLKRRFVPTTDSQHGLRRYPNLLRDRELTAPNQAWVADITYICLPTSFVYLATLLDAYSRVCVGWQLSRHIDTQLALAALNMALSRRQVAPGLIHHSDQGVQYASHAYIERLQSVGAHISMAAVGNPYENAQAESFFKTLKREEVYLNEYRTLEEAQANLDHFIEAVYNTKRLHSSLGYLPPYEFEAQALGQSSPGGTSSLVW
jgi:transposase InsO family protein